MTKMTYKPIGMFQTPKDMDELMDWISAARDPMVTTAAMMMYNLMVRELNTVTVEVCDHAS